jgi:hypothetical protein
MNKLRAIIHILLHGNCIDPQDVYRTCAGCWKQLDIREPHVTRYQDTERFHFGCEPWVNVTEHEEAFDGPTNSERVS